MKKCIWILFALILAAPTVFAKPKESVPVFDGGTVINLRDFKASFRDDIFVLNYSSASRGKFDFYFYSNEKDSWKRAGEVDLPSFGSEAKAYKKPGLKKPVYVAFVTNLSDDFNVIASVEGHDLRLRVFDSSVSFVESETDFDRIEDSKEKGVIKLRTNALRPDYSSNLRVLDAPNCVIFYREPKSGLWDVFGVVRGGRLWSDVRGAIDTFEPSWVVEIIDARKDYKIEASTRFDDLYLTFVKEKSMLSVKKFSPSAPESVLSFEDFDDGDDDRQISMTVDDDISSEGIFEPDIYTSAISGGDFIFDESDEDFTEKSCDDFSEPDSESAVSDVTATDATATDATASDVNSRTNDLEVAEPESELETEPEAEPDADTAFGSESNGMEENVVSDDDISPDLHDQEKIEPEEGDEDSDFGGGDLAENLLLLKKLYEDELIDEDEYKLKKAQLLGL